MNINQTNHAHINLMVQLFENESQAFRKIHRMIDLFETIIKTYTAVIVSNYFANQQVSDRIKGLFAEGLRVPSLGIWQLFNWEICKEMDKTNHKFFISNFFEYYKTLTTQYIDKIISVRNKYAHGATPDDNQCLKDINDLLPKLNFMLQADWLKETTIVIFSERFELISPEGGSYPEDLLDKALKNNSSIIPYRPYLIKLNENFKLLDLFPILVYKEIVIENNANDSLVFYNDLKKKQTACLIHYPFALFFWDQNVYEKFQDKFPLNIWRDKTTNEFKQRIEELTEVFKGRTNEKDSIKDFIKNNNKGYLIITGSPGIGKSALLAQVIKEISPDYSSDGDNLTSNVDVIEYFVRRGTIYADPYYLMGYINEKLEILCKTGIAVGSTLQDLYKNQHQRLIEINKSNRDKKIVLIVDGLDEGINEGTNIIQYLPKETYNNIIIIYGSRKISHTEYFFKEIQNKPKQQIEILGLSKDDIRALLYEITNKYVIEQQYIEAIAEKSEGNPLYLKMLCEAIENKQIKLNESLSLPSGDNAINQFYKAFIDRFSSGPDGDKILDTIYVFATAKDYLSPVHLEHILDIGQATARKIILVLQEILLQNPRKEDEYQLFHESLREFLLLSRTDKIISSGKKIIAYCEKWYELQQFDLGLQEYPAKYYAFHLFQLNQHEQLLKLTDNEKFINWQIQVTHQYNYSFQLFKYAMIFEQQKLKINDLLTKEDINQELNKYTISIFDQVISIAVRCAKTHSQVTGYVNQIIEWAKEGNEESLRLALECIKLFNKRDPFLLYMQLLFFILIKSKNQNLHQKSDWSNLILDHLSRSLTLEPFNNNWSEFYPIALMGEIVYEMRLLNIPTNIFFKNSAIKDDVFLYVANKFVENKRYNGALQSSIEIQNDEIKAITNSNISKQLASNKDFNWAIEICEKIEIMKYQDETNVQIIKELVDSEQIEQALDLLKKVKDKQYVYSAIKEIESILAGQLNIKTIDLQKNIEKQKTKIIDKSESDIKDILKISNDYIITGEIEKANHILLNNIKDNNKFINEDSKYIFIYSVIPSLLINNDPKSIINFISGNFSPDSKIKLFQVLSNALIKNKDIENALNICSQIADTKLKDESYIDVAVELVNQNNEKKAIELEMYLKSEDSLIDFYLNILTTMIANSKVKNSFKLIEKYFNNEIYDKNKLDKVSISYYIFKRFLLLTDLTYQLIKIEDSFSVEKMIRILIKYTPTIKYEGFKFRAFIELYKIYKKLKKNNLAKEYFDNAINIIDQIKFTDEKCRALLVIYIEAWNNGNEVLAKTKLNNAIEIAEQEKTKWIKTGLLKSIIYYLSEAGKYDKADEINSLFPYYDDRKDSIKLIHKQRILKGDFEEVFNKTNEIEDQNFKNELYILHIKYLARQENLIRAIEIYSLLTDFQDQESAIKILIDSVPDKLFGHLLIFIEKLDNESLSGLAYDEMINKVSQNLTSLASWLPVIISKTINQKELLAKGLLLYLASLLLKKNKSAIREQFEKINSVLDLNTIFSGIKLAI